jgi:hypothetical protein
LRQISAMPLPRWYDLVTTAINHAYLAWIQDYIRTYPLPYQHVLHAVLDLQAPVTTRPRYLALAGDRARAGLRFKVPFLRFFDNRLQPIPPCAWCRAPHAENGLHLLQCPSQPPGITRAVRAARAAVLPECGRAARNPASLTTAIVRLDWGARQSATTTLHVLRVMSAIINSYRYAVAPPRPGDRDHPISPVRTLALALCRHCGLQISEHLHCACRGPRPPPPAFPPPTLGVNAGAGAGTLGAGAGAGAGADAAVGFGVDVTVAAARGSSPRFRGGVEESKENLVARVASVAEPQEAPRVDTAEHGHPRPSGARCVVS